MEDDRWNYVANLVISSFRDKKYEEAADWICVLECNCLKKVPKEVYGECYRSIVVWWKRLFESAPFEVCREAFEDASLCPYEFWEQRKLKEHERRTVTRAEERSNDESIREEEEMPEIDWLFSGVDESADVSPVEEVICKTPETGTHIEVVCDETPNGCTKVKDRGCGLSDVKCQSVAADEKTPIGETEEVSKIMRMLKTQEVAIEMVLTRGLRNARGLVERYRETILQLPEESKPTKVIKAAEYMLRAVMLERGGSQEKKPIIRSQVESVPDLDAVKGEQQKKEESSDDQGLTKSDPEFAEQVEDSSGETANEVEGAAMNIDVPVKEKPDGVIVAELEDAMSEDKAEDPEMYAEVPVKMKPDVEGFKSELVKEEVEDEAKDVVCADKKPELEVVGTDLIEKDAKLPEDEVVEADRPIEPDKKSEVKDLVMELVDEDAQLPEKETESIEKEVEDSAMPSEPNKEWCEAKGLTIELGEEEANDSEDEVLADEDASIDIDVVLVSCFGFVEKDIEKDAYLCEPIGGWISLVDVSNRDWSRADGRPTLRNWKWRRRKTLKNKDGSLFWVDGVGDGTVVPSPSGPF